MLSMKFQLHPAPRLLMECTVCRQYMDSEAIAETRKEVALFGAKQYDVCSGCGAEVPPLMQDAAYKARWTRCAERKMGKQQKRATEERWFVFTMDDYVGAFPHFRDAAGKAKNMLGTNRRLTRLHAGFYELKPTVINSSSARTVFIADRRGADRQGFDIELMRKRATEGDDGSDTGTT